MRDSKQSVDNAVDCSAIGADPMHTGTNMLQTMTKLSAVIARINGHVTKIPWYHSRDYVKSMYFLYGKNRDRVAAYHVASN